jgi:hypothetical protein
MGPRAGLDAVGYRKPLNMYGIEKNVELVNTQCHLICMYSNTVFSVAICTVPPLTTLVSSSSSGTYATCFGLTRIIVRCVCFCT